MQIGPHPSMRWKINLFLRARDAETVKEGVRDGGREEEQVKATTCTM